MTKFSLLKFRLLWADLTRENADASVNRSAIPTVPELALALYRKRFLSIFVSTVPTPFPRTRAKGGKEFAAHTASQGQ